MAYSQTQRIHTTEALMKISIRSVAEVLLVHQMDVQRLQNTCLPADQHIFV
jgi:hypothetical protein